MSIVGKSSYFMFPALSQHVFFRHARVSIKQKVTDTICDDQSSNPLIYIRHLPFHIFERLFIIFKCPSVIVTTFAGHLDQWHCWIHRQKHCEEDRQRNSQRIANQAFYPVPVNECPNEKYLSQPHTLTVTTFSRRILMSKNKIVYCP